MLNPSRRAQEIGASPIRSLIPFADRAKQEGKNIFHLNIGQPDIETPQSALNAIKNLDTSIVNYGPSEGMPELRDAVAKYYDKFEARVGAEHVYVTTGASEAILFALLATCDSGDEVIIPEPFYANYLGFSHMANINIVPITTVLETEFALPSPSDFEKKITPKTKAIFLCNPGNPTGQLYTGQQLEELALIVKRHKIFLIVDEVYREFCYDETFTSVLSFRDIEDQVIVIDSISKVFSSCGARVGYLISKNKPLLESISKYAQLRLCPPYFGQRLALACYENADQYIDKARSEYRQRREVLFDSLNTIPGLTFYKPKAAFYNIVALPVKNAHAYCQWLLTDFDHQGDTIMLTPGNGFYSNRQMGKNQVRIAYILESKKLQKAINCLRISLTEYQDRSDI